MSCEKAPEKSEDCRYAGPEFDDDEMRLDVRGCAREQCGDVCSTDFLRRKLPIITWLPRYSFSFALQDLVAGLTVGMTAIPQGIAYAVVAGLEPQYGLYAGFMGAFTYIFFGSCKDITIGPTAILALMCQKAVEDYGADFAVLLCFLSGFIILLFGILNLGFLVDFISMPVTVGFTSAAAITIASSQLKSLLGISGKSNEFLESWTTVIDNIHETTLGDTLLGVITIIVLLLARLLNRVQFKGDNLNPFQKVVNKTLWFLAMARNAIVAIAGTVLAYILSRHGDLPFRITGDIGEGLPPFQPPPFSTDFNCTNVTIATDATVVTDATDVTETCIHYNFGEMLSALGTSSITIPLISILESIAIAKAFSKGKALDATQEMIALGLCNIFGSFVRSMPTTGSFTRTAVNNASGVRTQMGGLFTGALVLLALGLLTSTFKFIPKATLAGIIIAAMFFMVEYEVIHLLWKTRKIDLIPLIVTVIVCLFAGLELGIVSGIAVNLLFILYDAARPRVCIQSLKIKSYDVLLVTPDQSVVFPAAEFFRRQIIQKCVEMDNNVVVVIDGHRMRHIDATVAKNLQSLSSDLKARDQKLMLWNWNKSSQVTLSGLDPKLALLIRDEATLDQIFRDSSSENGSIPLDSSQSHILTVN